MNSITTKPIPRPTHLWLAIALSSLAACSQGEPSAAAPTPAVAAPVLDASLQAIYDRSCKSCHSLPASGAPQQGDAQAWAPRVAKGADVLLDHTINGFQGMPPMGACMDCNEEQYRALIAYMSQSKFE